MGKRILHDRYFKQAKAEGYAARSAYKLTEIDERHKILGRGIRVLDLGCSPGSWLQVASERVGAKGFVVGIDLKPVTILEPANVRTFVGDMRTADAGAWCRAAGGARFDAVISDMAPNTTGAGDDLVSAQLCREVLAVLPRAIKPGGRLVMKILEGSEYPSVLRETKRLFDDAKGFKPKASRDVSREMFIVAWRYKGPLEHVDLDEPGEASSESVNGATGPRP